MKNYISFWNNNFGEFEVFKIKLYEKTPIMHDNTNSYYKWF